MKFTTTENRSYSVGQYIPKSWIDYDLNHEKSIKKYFNGHIRVQDTDNCEFETHDFLFEDGKTFRLEYSYWIDQSNEDEDLNGFYDEYTIKEISADDADVPNKKDRDFIV